MPAPSPAPPLVDPPAAVPGLRTLGHGAQQAMPGATTLDQIPAAYAITGYACSVGVVEVGATVSNPSFTATYNRPAVSATINDGAGALAITLPANAWAYNAGGLPARTYTYTNAGVNATQSFTLIAYEDPLYPKASTRTITWEARAYWGVAVPAAYTSAFITGLASSALQGGRARSGIAYNTGAGQKMYYVVLTAFGGAPAIFVDASTGFAAGFSVVANVNVTNANGVILNYEVWESDQANLGAVTVNVS